MAETRDALRGKTCLVTGATNGIGRSSALGLAALGAKLVLVCRNPQRAAETRTEIADRTGNADVEIILADLASLSEIRRAAEQFLATGSPLHVLLNNAGVVHTRRSETVDGIETTFAVNHLAPFLLTNLLLERIRASAPGAYRQRGVRRAPASAARSTSTTSAQRSRFSGWRSTGGRSSPTSTSRASSRGGCEGTGVTVNALHPGAVRTGLGQNNDAPILKLLAALARPFLRSPEKGAETSIWACSAPELAKRQRPLLQRPQASARPIALALDDDRCAATLGRVGQAREPPGVTR